MILFDNYNRETGVYTSYTIHDGKPEYNMPLQFTDATHALEFNEAYHINPIAALAAYYLQNSIRKQKG